jgi:outer membrane protein OmpA-like peptidoglycan-associated protein
LELYRFLQARPNQCIRIVGHTDNIGSDRSNQILSEGRCQEVRRAMIERGISPDRIQTEGRGKRDPIVPNDSDEHRQMNRRVEIVLL